MNQFWQIKMKEGTIYWVDCKILELGGKQENWGQLLPSLYIKRSPCLTSMKLCIINMILHVLLCNCLMDFPWNNTDTRIRNVYLPWLESYSSFCKHGFTTSFYITELFWKKETIMINIERTV